MSIPADIRSAIASLTCFVDNWLHGPEPASAFKLRELHAARVILAKARLALEACDAPPPTYELEPPAWFPAASLSHRLHLRAEARAQANPRLAPRMPHP